MGRGSRARSIRRAGDDLAHPLAPRRAPDSTARGAPALRAPGPAPGPLLLGGRARGAGGAASAHLDGKLDAAAIALGPDGEPTVAAWALGEGRGAGSPTRAAGLARPLRQRPAAGGHRASWRGDVHDWRLAPEQYGAMHFHADAVDDLGWEPSFELELAESLRRRRLRARARGRRRRGPWSRSSSAAPRGGAGRAERRPAADLHLPRLLVRARRARARPAPSEPEDRWVAEHGLRSLYDRHADGGGVYEASLLRPLTQLRPGYRCPQHGGPHGLAQDLILLGWLARRGHRRSTCSPTTTCTREGAAALAGHRTVITGAHPEYATRRAARRARRAPRRAAAASPTSAATGSTAASRSTPSART